MKKFNTLNKGFTLPELVVVVTIIAILSTVAFVSYSSFNIDARDATRKSDAGAIKISLKTTHVRKNFYPSVTGTTTQIIRTTGGTVVVATQGKLLSDLAIEGLNQEYLDPRTGQPYYYSSTRNGQEYQIGLTLEGEEPIALIEGDYRSVMSILPSIFAATSDSSIDMDDSNNQSFFVVNNSTKNLLYDFETSGIIKTATSLSEAVGSTFTYSASHTTCRSIFEAGKSSGSGTYTIRTSTGALTSTGCIMSY